MQKQRVTGSIKSTELAIIASNGILNCYLIIPVLLEVISTYA